MSSEVKDGERPDNAQANESPNTNDQKSSAVFCSPTWPLSDNVRRCSTSACSYILYESDRRPSRAFSASRVDGYTSASVRCWMTLRFLCVPEESTQKRRNTSRLRADGLRKIPIRSASSKTRISKSFFTATGSLIVIADCPLPNFRSAC
jgi:hypothetical protein